MDPDYDRIAEQYKRAMFQRPWRTHLERYTLLRLAGDVTGKAVIDLACGEGYYTRALRQQGAARVVGVDLSRAMIGLAEAEEARQPLGLEYRVGDVRTLEVPGAFDLAFAAYLLNYAHTAKELTQMCRAVARALRPGGRFVTANDDGPIVFEHACWLGVEGIASGRSIGRVEASRGERRRPRSASTRRWRPELSRPLVSTELAGALARCLRPSSALQK